MGRGARFVPVKNHCSKVNVPNKPASFPQLLPPDPILNNFTRSALRVRYTPLPQDDANGTPNGAVPSSLVGTTAVVDDGDDVLIVDPEAAAIKKGATISYHDDSDEVGIALHRWWAGFRYSDQHAKLVIRCSDEIRRNRNQLL